MWKRHLASCGKHNVHTFVGGGVEVEVKVEVGGREEGRDDFPVLVDTAELVAADLMALMALVRYRDAPVIPSDSRLSFFDKEMDGKAHWASRVHTRKHRAAVEPACGVQVEMSSLSEETLPPPPDFRF